jgi:hypothetical protein
MDTTNNKKEEFEFAFEESPVEIQVEEAEAFPAEFVESTEEIADKSEVIILTTSYCLRGKIALVPGARLTDYIVGAHPFIAVTDVEIRDKAGNLVLNTAFLDVNRDLIEIILPADLATVAEAHS